MADKIRYDVEVDSSDAISGLRDFSRAAQKAGKDAAKGLDETATAGDKARTAIKQMAATFDSELRGAAQAAEALSTALGPELAGKMDVTQVVLDLEKMGVTFDEIRLEADQFATTLRDIDGVRLQQVNDGLDTTRSKMDTMRSSSDQSRSVLANLAGNTAQDLGQLGGVVGSLGVGIGQLAEYAVDGNIALSNLAKVAGPMAGVAAALQLITTAIGGIKAEDAFKTQLVEDFSDALRDGATVAETLQEQLEKTGELDFETGLFGGGGILGLGSKTKDLIGIFNNLGISFEQFTRLVEDSAASDKLNELSTAAFEAGEIELGVLYRDAADGLATYQGAAETAAQAQEELNEFLGPAAALSIEQAQEALDALADPLETLPGHWEALIRDVADGNLDFENAAQLIEQLAEATDLETDAVIALAKEKADEEIQAQAEALEEATKAAEEAAEAHAALGEAVRQAGVEMDTAASRADGIAEAFDRLDESSALTNTEETLGVARDFKTALDELGDVDLTKTPLIQTDWNTLLDEDLGQAVEAVAGLRESLQGEMAQAFAREGPEGLREWAASTREGIESALRGTGDFTEAEITHILDQLGLLEEDVEISIKMAEQEQVLAALGTITSGIDGIPASVAFDVQMAINNNDPATAISLINGYLASIGEEPISISVSDDGTIQNFADDADAATEDRDAHVIVPKSPSLGQMEELLNAVARERTVQFVSKADNAGTVDSVLDEVANPGGGDRIAHYSIVIDNLFSAISSLNDLDNPRTVHLNVVRHTSSVGGGGGAAAGPTGLAVGPMAMGLGVEGGGGPGVAALAAPTPISAVTMAAPATVAPIVVEPRVTIQAGVIGDRFAVQRAVSRALKQSYRLNGRRRSA